MTYISYQLGMSISTFFAVLALMLYFYCLMLVVAFLCQWLDRVIASGWRASLQIIDEERELGKGE